MNPGKAIQVKKTPCVLALDGEREIVLEKGQKASIRLSLDGPKVVDIPAVMSQAAQKGVFKHTV